MRARKISWGMSGRILTGLLVIGLMAYALWPPPQFGFLRGHQPVHINDFKCVYKLSGDPVELNQRIDRELTGQSFRRITEQRWPKGRKVEYRSEDKKTQAFLVLETD